MPERETPGHDSNNVSDDLFSRLPDPTHRPPTVDSTPPAPGSRRARREAAADGRTDDIAAQPVSGAPGDASAAHEEASDSPATDGEGAPAASPPARSGASLDDLFAADSGEHAHPPRGRRKRRTGCIVALVIVLALLGGIAVGGVWVMNTYGDKISDIFGWGDPADWEEGVATGEAFVTIKEGDTGAPISAALYEAGVTRTEDVFYDYLVAENLSIPFYPGVYRLQEKMTAAAAADALQDPANKMENTISILEGGTVNSSLAVISESIGIPLEDLQAAVADPSAYGVDAERLDGWLFPAVYTFDPETTAEQIIQRMVDRTREALTASGVQPGDENRVLTIASIVQREGHLADFDKVSRVIANRLDPANDETHGLLQMDSTAQFGYGLTHEGPVSSWSWAEVTADENPWNTYVHQGLPVSPISNPSEAAIQAAQNPAEGPWFYFVTVNLDTGETVFSATYAEQQAAEARYRQWCEDNPDGGCY